METNSRNGDRTHRTADDREPDDGPPNAGAGAELRRWTVPEGAGGRLDVHAAAVLETSRSRAAALVEEGRVRVDGRAPKKSDVVSAGQAIEVRTPPPVPASAEPEDIPLDIVFEDDDLVVVD